MAWCSLPEALLSHVAAVSPLHRVLGNVHLLRHITSFQSGFPRDVVQLATQELGATASLGRLPRLAIRNGDLAMLQRLYRLQLSDITNTTELSFERAWLDALEAGSVGIAQWLDNHDRINSSHNATTTLCAAVASDSVELMSWLLWLRPQYTGQFSPAVLHHPPSFQLFQWLEANVDDLPISSSLVDEYASRGQLELVQYLLSSHRDDYCSNRTIARAAGNGHLAVVQYLHTQCHTHCTPHAMRVAALSGQLDVVRFLNENCCEADGQALEFAASGGNMPVVAYLTATRTDGNMLRALARADHAQNHDIADFLTAILNPAAEAATT